MIKKIIVATSLIFLGCATNQMNFNQQTNTENIILNKPQKDNSNIVTLFVVGEGVAPVNAINSAQAKILARRAAIADAYRQLAEKMYGVKVTAKETVKDLMLKNSDVHTYVEGLIRGANIQAEKFEDGIYYVTMSLKLDVRMWNKFINNN